MVLMKIYNRLRLIVAVTKRNNRSYREYMFGISYLKLDIKTNKLFTDYNNAITLDLIIIHFAIEWKTK